MKKLYVVGNQSSKSLSPLIFNHWFKKYNIDAKYNYLQLTKKNFDKEIKKTLKDKNVIGLNITIPFKRQIIKHLKKLDTHSKKIEAVNCVVNTKNTKGYNTDWIGYYNSLPKFNNFSKHKVVLIGYGGAAHAIHYLLLKKGVKKIVIINKTKRKIKFSNKIQFTQNISAIKKNIETASLIINATPKNPINKNLTKLVKKTTILSDVVYKPKETIFLKQFPKNKKTYGISMLIQQAVPCFKIWFGITPSVDSELIKKLNKEIR